MARRRLALTMGDPAGIGPEIVVKAVCAVAARDRAAPALIIVGSRAPLIAELRRAGLPDDALGRAGVDVVEATVAEAPIRPATDSSEGGRLAYAAVARAVAMALAGEVDAIVTAPLSKAALNPAGYPFPGHTRLLASLTGTSGTVLMLAHGPFRVTHSPPMSRSTASRRW